MTALPVLDPIPTIPVIGAAVEYLNMTITRTGATNYCVLSPSGSSVRVQNPGTHELTAFYKALNVARKQVNLPALRRVCRSCQARPVSALPRAVLCEECANRKPSKSAIGREGACMGKRGMTPELVHDIARFRQGIKLADAIIARRGGEVRAVNDDPIYLAQCRARLKALQEKQP